MHILGEPVVSGAFLLVWAARAVVRDVLNYRWKQSVLKRVPDDQMVDVLRELRDNRRETS